MLFSLEALEMGASSGWRKAFAEMRSAYGSLTRTMMAGLIAIVAALIGVAGALLS
jgi:hypothetical protein